jgi:DNA gyrase/topoisomerase IV subunit A
VDIQLPKLYKDYGQYSNYRNFPLDLDGLKPVERRVLLSAFKIARDKFVKSRQVDAYTIGHFHPHGECYGTIVQLVKQGFLEGQGNFGSSVGVEPVGPAAPRYTECKIQRHTIEMAFKYIRYVPIIPTELNDEEPLYLPTMYPVCLLGQEYTQGIGFGFKTLIPCYKVEDLHKRLLWLIGERKTKPTIVPISDCKITATEKDLEDLLTTGKAKIAIEGVFTSNPRTNRLTLASWPPGKRFESLLNAFSKELEAGLIGVIDLSSKNKTEIVFEVLRERNRDKIFQDFIKKMKRVVQGAVSFEIQVVDINQKVLTKSVDNMLLDTYKMFKDLNEKVLKDEIQKIDDVIKEYILLEKIRNPLSLCIKDGWDLDKSVKTIADLVNVEDNLVRELIDKYKIRKLLTLDTDTTGLEKEKEEAVSLLNSLDNHVLNQYKEFK